MLSDVGQPLFPPEEEPCARSKEDQSQAKLYHPTANEARDLQAIEDLVLAQLGRPLPCRTSDVNLLRAALQVRLELTCPLQIPPDRTLCLPSSFTMQAEIKAFNSAHKGAQETPTGILVLARDASSMFARAALQTADLVGNC